MSAGSGWPHEKQTEGCPGVAIVIMEHAGQRTCTTAGAGAIMSMPGDGPIGDDGTTGAICGCANAAGAYAGCCAAAVDPNASADI